MKKRIFFAMLISAFAAGSFLVSCDDDDEGSGCTCTVYYDDEEVTSETFTAEEMKEEDISSCSELEEYLVDGLEDSYDVTVECR